MYLRRFRGYGVLGGFSNFVHKKDKLQSIKLQFNIDVSGIDILKDHNVKIVFEIGIGKEQKKADIQKIIYILDNNHFMELEDGKIRVNIKHRKIQEWVYTISKSGNWSDSEMELYLQNIGDLEYSSNAIQINKNFIDYLKNVDSCQSTELDIARENCITLKKHFLSWTKEFDDLKIPVYALTKAHDYHSSMKETIEACYVLKKPTRNSKDHNNIFQKTEGINYPSYSTNEYLLDEEDTLSLKTILMHLSLDLILDIPIKFYEYIEKPFMYIGPLRFYPERHTAYQSHNEVTSNSSEDFWSQLQDNENMMNSLNEWLIKLDTPYEIRFRKIYDLDELFDKNTTEISQEELGDNESAVEEFVFIDKRSGTPVHNREMGLGITQLLPILGNSLAKKNHMIAVEQPELHLHPKLQAEIADEFIRSYKKKSNDFLLETHSEHLLLRIMKRMRYAAENKRDRDKGLDLTPDDVCLLYINTNGTNTYITELDLDKDGTLLDL